MTESSLRDAGYHNSDSGGSMFREASGITIHGGIFNAYGSGGMDDKNRILEEKERIANEQKRIADEERRIKAMAILRSRAEHGAPYDAAAREDVPKCHEHTRVSIINGIYKWARSQKPSAPQFMWMYGPAGSGKTTIMQTVAETLDKEKSLASSFFFSRLAAARPTDKENFVITLAYQLSLCIPALQQPVADALSDLSILTKSLAKQLDVLVIGPLNKLDPAQGGSRCIFMVDGLDECVGDTPQRDILNLLERFLHQATYRVRILVSSRPLSHLQAFFSQSGIREMTQTTPLDNNYQSDGDIEKFLLAKFEKIRSEHPSRGGLPSEWPSQSNVETLVGRASGQFIYASVIMKFIGNHGRHPDESLQTIISLKGGQNARPYEELDAVYSQVLSTIEPQNIEFVHTLMGCLLLEPGTYYFAQVAQTEATTAIDVLFMIPRGTTDARINRIYPLITASSDGMKFSHASFPEYLRDRSRSQDFFLDMAKVHCTLARCWFDAYSAHFKLHPHSGIVPINMASYTWRLGEAGETGMVILDVVTHCKEAEWTSELQQSVLTFDIQAALSAPPEWFNNTGEYILWYGTVLWLDFTFWVEQRHLLSSANTEKIRRRMQIVIQSVFLELKIAPTIMRAIAGLLTLRKYLTIRNCWLDMRDIFDRKYGCDDLISSLDWRGSGNDLYLCEAACSWLCKILAGDVEMTGSFFDDGSLYTDLTLLYAQAQHVKALSKLPNNVNHAVMLSKAWPSDELAIFLMQNVLQLEKRLLPEGTNYKEFMTTICIYLYECGIPFISEHRHRPGYDAHDWVCGICILFDPFGVECPDIELSRDPAAKTGPKRVQIADEEIPEPIQVNAIQEFVPAVPVLWLQMWTLWLADMVFRFFPVVA